MAQRGRSRVLVALLAIGCVAAAILVVQRNRSGFGPEGGEAGAEHAELVARLKPQGVEFWRDEDRPGKPVRQIRVGLTPSKVSLAELYPFKQLRSVHYLTGTVKQGELAKLAEAAPHIRQLQLQCVVADDCLQELAAFGELEDLTLESTSLTDAGFKHVAVLKRVHSLSFPFCSGLTDAGLRELNPLSKSKLRHLNLFQTKITDKGLPDLLAFTELESLLLGGTYLSGEGVQKLSALKNLKSLQLSDSINEDAREWLRKSIPGCKVFVN